jgi:hypothetical protein
MGGSNLPQQQQIASNLTPEQNAQRIERQGMSDQGIVSLGEGVTAAKDLYKDVKRTMIDPAITAVKDGATMYMDGKIPYTIPSAVNTLKDTFTAPQNQMMTKTTEYRDLTPEEMATAEMYPMMTKKTGVVFDKIDPILGTKIKGMISQSGIQQNTTIDNVRYDRDATGSEFKGVKAKPAKSVINMTAEEAMKDL